MASSLLLALAVIFLADARSSEGAREGTLRFAPDSALVRIPIDVRGNLVYLRGRVDGSDSLWIVIDSGSSNDAISESRARALGLTVAGTSESHGAGGTVTAGTISSAEVALPGVTLAGEPLGTLPLDSMATRTGRALEVILGHPLLSRCVLAIDYAAGRITIRPGDSFRYSGSGTVLPLEFVNRLPYVTARLALPGRAPIQGRFVIDTGSGHALILAAPFVRKERVLEALPRTIEARGLGVGGESFNRLGRVEGLEVGGLRIDRPTAMLRLSDRGLIAAHGAIGNIGGEILRRFTVIFDYPRQRLILEPNAHFAEEFEADMSGLGISAGSQGPETVRVDWIQPGSPAEEAGVRPGDRIESVDDRPVASLGVPALRVMFRRPAEAHRLGIRRGEERLELVLTTRRLI